MKSVFRRKARTDAHWCNILCFIMGLVYEMLCVSKLIADSLFSILGQVVAYTKKGDRLVGQIAKRQVCDLVKWRSLRKLM